jgi:hypothetical protein
VTSEWLPPFLGAFVGSGASFGVAYVARGTSLEGNLGTLAVSLHERVYNGAMSAAGAADLLVASRPRRAWLATGRARRVNGSIDEWLRRYSEAELKANARYSSTEQDYPVVQAEGGIG